MIQFFCNVTSPRLEGSSSLHLQGHPVQEDLRVFDDEDEGTGLLRNVGTYSKGKAIPLQALTSPEGSRSLRFPDFKTIGTYRWQGCQPYAPAAFTPRKYSWYSFLLEAESTPGP
jgi:hypothetical protein